MVVQTNQVSVGRWRVPRSERAVDGKRAMTQEKKKGMWGFLFCGCHSGLAPVAVQTHVDKECAKGKKKKVVCRKLSLVGVIHVMRARRGREARNVPGNKRGVGKATGEDGPSASEGISCSAAGLVGHVGPLVVPGPECRA